ncbi:MFS transporter [Salinispora arenicola]|uniref:MFS transporter n=1 Tax=Salinispora arenicola TaxID=168697 RepID=UPI000475C03D|nr:MFS transporter [Salinispora arenicola]
MNNGELGAAEAPRTASGRPVRRWPAATVGVLAVFLGGLNISLLVIALPTIRSVFDLSPSGQQWLISGYFLTFGLVLVPAGRYGDLRGRRNVFVAGIALFVVASTAAGFAPSGTWLIVARLAQGVGVGMALPQVFGTVQRMFAARERGRPLGLLAAAVSASRLAGPVLGGVLVTVGGAEQGWRWIFLINVPIGIIVAAFGWRLFPVAERDQRSELDLIGALLLICGLGLLWLMQGEQWPGLLRWLFLPAGVAMLAAFVLWERSYAHRGEPIFNLNLFRIRTFALGAFIATFYFAGYDAIYYLLSEYLQNGLGHSELVAGIALMPLALGTVVGSVAAGAKAGRVGRPLIAVGLAFAAVGLAVLLVADLFLPGPNSPHAATLPLLLVGLGGGLATAGVGGGLVIAPNQTLALSHVPPAEGGSAGGMLQTGQRFGGGVGVAVIGTALFASLENTGDWLLAFRIPMAVIIGFFVTALVAALIDLVTRSRTH